MKLGMLIREKRKQKGYTQQKLADMVGISASYVQLLETSVRRPSKEVLKRLCEKLSITELELQQIEQEPLLSSTRFHRLELDETVREIGICLNLDCPGRIIDTKTSQITHAWSYRYSQFGEQRFCQFCGRELIFECPLCDRKISSPTIIFCPGCGEQMFDITATNLSQIFKHSYATNLLTQPTERILESEKTINRQGKTIQADESSVLNPDKESDLNLQINMTPRYDESKDAINPSESTQLQGSKDRKEYETKS